MSRELQQGRDLRQDLDRAAARGGAELRAVHAAAATRIAGPRALPLVWLLPMFGLLTGILALATGASPRLVSLPIMLALMACAPLLLIAYFALRAWLVSSPRRTALAVVDEGLELAGRALAADEFLNKQDLGSFERAALEDALPAVRRAARAPLELPRSGWSPGEESAPHLVAGALALFSYAWFSSFVTGPGERPAAPRNTTTVAELDAPKTSPRSTRAEPRLQPQPNAPKATPKEPKTGQPATPKRGDKAALLPDDMRTSAGKTGKGKSSEAQSQSSASESRGAPSGQSPAPPKEGSKKRLEAKKPKKKTRADEPPREPKEEDEPGGSTAGRGSAKGSNRNTTTSKWSSKDQVTTPDDQEIEDDEDTEDENEEQKNRGGMQPNLRDRRPPTSRDLRIGFGNRPNPDANGRGGPSEAKKSRGTASLVLGVPIPDRIKGQPNAGPTRITQERIEPSAEESKQAAAEARRAREAAIGQLARPAPPKHPRLLAPWQRQLIQTYIDGRRLQAQKAPKTQP